MIYPISTGKFRSNLFSEYSLNYNYVLTLDYRHHYNFFKYLNRRLKLKGWNSVGINEKLYSELLKCNPLNRVVLSVCVLRVLRSPGFIAVHVETWVQFWIRNGSWLFTKAVHSTCSNRSLGNPHVTLVSPHLDGGLSSILGTMLKERH